MSAITQEELKVLFHYDPETGDFIRLTAKGRCGRVGAIAGSPHVKRGYRQILIRPKGYKAHRLAWLYMLGEWPPVGFEIDHIDGNRDNNRWSNLRLVKRRENTMNRQSFGKGLKGTSRASSGRFQAYIGNGKNRLHLGTYDTETEAHEAYCRAAKERYGEFFNDGTHLKDKAA